ncbi:MAG: WYL domain-containing protein [Bifidobacteriaceae bacterium]|jgi:proteasome accessory factor B|nr:WYL domain-containing protein [Bifidobacteriaceae bacterium]
MAESPEAAERLLNLVIALTNAPRPMSKGDVRARVAGYAGGDQNAFERRFERDKDLLRDLGVPVEAVAGAVHGDEHGYRIDLESAAMPPVEFTAAEVGALGVAAQAWRDASLREPAERALVKLRAIGYRPVAADPQGVDLRLRTPDAAFDTLLRAIDERRAVAFDYRTGRTGEVARRRVEPWRLRSRGRAWYLAGRDRDLDAPRVFRLSRIAGPVRPSRAPAEFEPPPAPRIDAAFADRAAASAPRVANVAVLPGHASLLRARASAVRRFADDAGTRPPAQSPLADANPGANPGTSPGANPAAGPDANPGAGSAPEAFGRDVLTLAFGDLDEFAGELAGLGSAGIVLDPPDLRDAVVSRLRAAWLAHADGAEGGGADG